MSTKPYLIIPSLFCLERIGVFLAGLIVTTFASCSPPIDTKAAASSARPLTISYAPAPGRGGVVALDLTVEVSTKNLRRPSATATTKHYRTFQKIIDGVLYQRTDFEVDLNGVKKPQSVVTNGRDTVVFDPQNEGKAERLMAGATGALTKVPVGGDLSRKIPDLGHSLQRMALQAFRVRAATDPTVTSVDWSGSTPVDASRTLVKRSLQFDGTDSVLKSEQDVVVDSSGVQTITAVDYSYASTPAGPVLSQTRTITKVDYPYTLDVSGLSLPRVDSLDQIRSITPEELEGMKAKGALVYQTNPLIGDPSDPDQTTETVETYTQIKVNQTDDNLFQSVR